MPRTARLGLTRSVDRVGGVRRRYATRRDYRMNPALKRRAIARTVATRPLSKRRCTRRRRITFLRQSFARIEPTALGLHPADQELALVDQFLRQRGVQIDEE